MKFISDIRTDTIKANLVLSPKGNVGIDMTREGGIYVSYDLNSVYDKKTWERIVEKCEIPEELFHYIYFDNTFVYYLYRYPYSYFYGYSYPYSYGYKYPYSYSYSYFEFNSHFFSYEYGYDYATVNYYEKHWVYYKYYEVVEWVDSFTYIYIDVK